jgi:predicted CXXCH cytochrome family protein
VHGKRIAAGDTKAATCISCHSVHNILKVSDPRSPVYPTHVVDTCARCHADAKLMQPYGIPTDQVAKYKRSVHYRALIKKNDLSAPTCNDCHGSHGAAPPGVDSISNVCGTCHLQNMELFQASPHAKPFAEMGSGACEACHGNHEIKPPTDQFVGTDENAVCAQCHEADDPGGTTAAAIRSSLELVTDTLGRARTEVADAKRKGMLMEDAAIDLETANEELIKARIQVHKASFPDVQAHTSKAVAAAKKALAAAAAARREIRTRRTGLSVALGLILIAIVALILKIRQIES